MQRWTMWKCCVALCCVALCCCFLSFGAPRVSAFQASEIVKEEPELIDQEPFDLVILKAEAGGESVKVFPIPFPGRKVPANPRATERLDVVLQKFPEREYEVLWRDIQEIQLFEDRIYRQAVRRMGDKDFTGAFQNLSYLMKNYPKTPGLDGLLKGFLLQSAADRFNAGSVAQTLSALEELRSLDRRYQASAVTTGLSKAADSLVKSYQQAGDLTNAKAILSRLQRKYGSELPVVGQWQTRLEAMARSRMDEAQSLMKQGKYREARKAAVDMLGILPSFQPGKDLIEEINTTHPMVRVGVMQKSDSLDPASLVNWPARRAGALVNRPLVRFDEISAEGGKYDFALGSFDTTIDNQELILSLDPNVETSIDAFSLAQILVDRGNPKHEKYDSSWAAILHSVQVRSARQVVVRLKRPNVLPVALMQWIVASAEGESLLTGPYEESGGDAVEAAFRLRPDFEGQGIPVEIVEVFYDDPKSAVNDLLLGEIDILDQVYPVDARRIQSDRRLRVGAYSLPTTHMLIPLSDDPYLENTKFRRAMMYGCDREAMLAGELLNSTDPNDGRVVSGPFPVGDGRTDALAYAYDDSIEPIDYSPPLARLLSVMADDEVAKSFNRKREPVPKRRKLVVGCPDFEFARVAVQGLVQQWANVGIEAEMRIIDPGQILRQTEGLDLVYVMATMWEPATDIERLLGDSGVASSDDPYIVQGLERLRAARSWPEVRIALVNLHRLIDYHLPVLPLWQVADQFVVRRTVDGVKDRPVSLYENVTKWRVNLGAAQSVEQ